MGDIADMMLDGFLCQLCGGVMEDMSPTDEELAAAPKDKNGIPIIEDRSPGYPRTCASCKHENRPRWRKKKHKGGKAE